MKIGLCACFDIHNYGSQLQSYASLTLLQEMGHDVDLIKYKKKLSPGLIVKTVPRLFNHAFVTRRMRIYHNKMIKKINRTYLEVISNRDLQFKKYIDLNFRNYVSISYGYKELTEDAKKYDAIIVGSDQLWLPSGMASNFYNLMFVPDEIRKISFATSFGVSFIPSYQKAKTKQYLERFNYISVRENAGKRIVEELTSKKAFVAVDPTMMLTSDQWSEKIGRRLIDEKYIFCYYLGNTPEYRRYVKEFSERNNIQVLNLAYIDEYVESDGLFKNVKNVGPFEFVNLIKNAEYIFTDSFHGSAFSIIFKKKFLVFNRFNENDKNSRNSRIDNLTNMLGLQNRRFNGEVDLILKPIDYNLVLSKLETEKRKTREFLLKALS